MQRARKLRQDLVGGDRVITKDFPVIELTKRFATKLPNV